MKSFSISGEDSGIQRQAGKMERERESERQKSLQLFLQIYCAAFVFKL